MNNRKKRYMQSEKLILKRYALCLSNYLMMQGDYEPTLLLNKYKKPSLKLGSQI